jgi:effector-binding domain-containing protein
MTVMKKRWKMIAAIVAVLVLGGVLAGPIMSDVQRPDYEVISTAEAGIEIRRYAPMIIAQVTMQGEREEAIGDGFRLLADYIFGNNTVSQEIAMTAPVQQQASEKIAMTAPVQQQAEGNAWTVSFVMPSEYTMESLPKPNNERVTLKQVPAKRLIAITFSGTNSNENIAEHEQQLKAYIQANNLQTTGQPTYAFYNPPWTLPPMRRNEVMIELE